MSANTTSLQKLEMTAKARLRTALAIITVFLINGCSSIPFVGDDDDGRASERREKIELALVYVPKGELQCQDDTGDDLKTTKARLQDDGIRVYSSDCGVITGRMERALCGSITLDINIHEINAAAVSQAELLGFATIESLEEQDLEYKTRPCDN